MRPWPAQSEDPRPSPRRRGCAALAFTAALLAAAWATGSWSRPIDPAFVERWGLSLDDCLHPGRWWRLLTSLPFTGGGWMLVKVLALDGLALLAAEMRFGARRAAALTLGLHALGTSIEAALLPPLLAVDPALRDELMRVRDVGFSDGCYGALALVSCRLGPGLRIAALAAILLVILGNAGVHAMHGDARDLSGDIGHGIGAGVAVALAGIDRLALRQRTRAEDPA